MVIGCQPSLRVSEIHFVVLYHLSSRKLRGLPHMRSTVDISIMIIVHTILCTWRQVRGHRLEDQVTAQVC